MVQNSMYKMYSLWLKSTVLFTPPPPCTGIHICRLNYLARYTPTVIVAASGEQERKKRVFTFHFANFFVCE